MALDPIGKPTPAIAPRRAAPAAAGATGPVSAAPSDALAPGLRGTALPAAGRKAGLQAYDAGAEPPEDALSPDDHARFAFVERMLADAPHAGPVWRSLLADGRLTADRPRDAEGRSLLEAVHRLAYTELAPGIDPGAMLASVIGDIAHPTTITQGLAGTCAATSVQIVLARENPAEYARILTGLAAPGAGDVALAGGARLQRVPGSEGPGDVRAGKLGEGLYVRDERFVTGRLFQAAAMQLGLGGEVRYDAREDAEVAADGVQRASGLTDPQIAKLADAVGLAAGGRAIGAEDVDLAAARATDRRDAAELEYEMLKARLTRLDAEHQRLSRFDGIFGAGGDAGAADPLRQRLRALDGEIDQAFTALKAAGQAIQVAFEAQREARRAARPRIAAAVAEEAAAGRDVLVGIDGPGGGGHEVVVRRIDAREVTYDDPQGRTEVIPRAEFDRRVRGFVRRGPAAPPAERATPAAPAVPPPAAADVARRYRAAEEAYADARRACARAQDAHDRQPTSGTFGALESALDALPGAARRFEEAEAAYAAAGRP